MCPQLDNRAGFSQIEAQIKQKYSSSYCSVMTSDSILIIFDYYYNLIVKADISKDEKKLRDRELNPGLPRDRRGY